MVQIKLFSDQISYGAPEAIASYKGSNERRYTFNDSPAIEQQVNEFCNTHRILSVVPSVAVLGNNPPTSIITYTITYISDT